MSYRVITIGREFESNGTEIAQEVARRLHISYIDKFLITEAAQKSGFNIDRIRESDERLASRFEYSMAEAAETYGSGSTPVPTSEKVARIQFDLIREYAESEPCVIVGRCANYVLRDRDDVLDVYIYASFDYRVNQTMEKLQMTLPTATRLVRSTDKARSRYFKNFTGWNYKDLDCYQMILNSDRLGFEQCVQMIIDAYNGKKD